MLPREPIAALGTHEVTNQPPPLAERNLFETDPILRAAVAREGAGWAEAKLSTFGAVAGSERVRALAEAANRYPPELRAYDRFGHRIDEVAYHPAYHELMALATRHEVHSIAWTARRTGGHVAHFALEYMLVQAEAGVCCPITMTYAAAPTLRQAPDLAAEWEPRILSPEYDPRFVPAVEKAGATIGMAMTEKQGGSDLRAATTRATPLGGGTFTLTGHKWFCSAPMSDAFLTLAYTDTGLSCFFVPRWRPDGTRNAFRIQRLKDKLGDRSNASAEIEYAETWARLVGEEGRGVRTIIDMVHHTRLDTALAAAGMMREAVVQAVHHAAHRRAFERPLDRQPLMRNVLADMVVEWAAATMLAARVARGYDSPGDPFARIAVAVAKYWINKRLPNLVYEAMECLGGNGYVEESPMPRLYREAPVNSIWEGSGNVICLDVLRTIERAPESLDALLAEIEAARGADRRLDAAAERLGALIAGREGRARQLVEAMALALQGALVVRHAPPSLAEAFCASRLGGDWGYALGTLPPETAFDDLIALARLPEAEA